MNQPFNNIIQLNLGTANKDGVGRLTIKMGYRICVYDSYYFKGRVCVVRTFKRMLGNKKVAGNYNVGCIVKFFGTKHNAPKVLWSPLDDGSGTSCVDKSPYYATGTITNSGTGYWGSSSSYCYMNTPVLCETHTRSFPQNQAIHKTLSSYRYGFNGKEKDDETYGEGDEYDYGMRIYDPRLGRFMSLDPLAAKYHDLSPYNYVANNPIIFIDPDGKAIYLASNLTAGQRKEFIGCIQKLTSDKIIATPMKDGSYKIVILAKGNGKFPNGTNLVRELVSHQKSVTIKNGGLESYTNPKKGEDEINSHNGTGISTEIILGPALNFLTESNVDHKVRLTLADKYIMLGHEFIHALKMMDGKDEDDDKLDKIYNPYINENGENDFELVKVGEATAVGIAIPGKNPKGKRYTTENDLRKEHKKGKRVSYSSDGMHKKK